MDVPGALGGGRSLASPEYDGRLLGALLPQLRPPLRSFNAPYGMMMAPPDLMHALKAFRSLGSLAYMARLAGGYATDRLRFGRGTRLTMSNALVARLIRSAANVGVALWAETPALRLERENDRITGMVVRRDGRELLLKARKGVVLATGGFGANPTWRQRHIPQAQVHLSMVAEGNCAAGLQMALDAGAVLDERNAVNCAYTVVSRLEMPRGGEQKCMHFYTDLPKPGCIAVDARGQRFGNEAGLLLGDAMHQTGIEAAWLVCDSRFIRTYGLGLVLPFGLNLRRMRRLGYVAEAPSLAALARDIGVDPVGLESTAERHNRFARSGVDEDFGRGNSLLDRSMGNPAVRPNPCLGPVQTGPFYAVKVHPGDAGTVLGLRVDAAARALDIHGQPIAGLHVCGMNMNSIWAGRGVANGMNYAHNMTFGFIAGQILARP